MRAAIQKLDKKFGAFQALKEINLDVQDGELVALLAK
jgi:ABC-type sulfate/molybdate transport systems ATPase subunit